MPNRPIIAASDASHSSITGALVRFPCVIITRSQAPAESRTWPLGPAPDPTRRSSVARPGVPVQNPLAGPFAPVAESAAASVAPPDSLTTVLGQRTRARDSPTRVKRTCLSMGRACSPAHASTVMISPQSKVFTPCCCTKCAPAIASSALAPRRQGSGGRLIRKYPAPRTPPSRPRHSRRANEEARYNGRGTPP